MKCDPNAPVFSIYTEDADTILTKREHFAGLALQGLLSDRGNIIALEEASNTASIAVEIADALIAKLNEENDDD